MKKKEKLKEEIKKEEENNKEQDRLRLEELRERVRKKAAEDGYVFPRTFHRAISPDMAIVDIERFRTHRINHPVGPSQASSKVTTPPKQLSLYEASPQEECSFISSDPDPLLSKFKRTFRAPYRQRHWDPELQNRRKQGLGSAVLGGEELPPGNFYDPVGSSGTYVYNIGIPGQGYTGRIPRIPPRGWGRSRSMGAGDGMRRLS